MFKIEINKKIIEWDIYKSSPFLSDENQSINDRTPNDSEETFDS